jgi:hypothetical protein
MVDKPVYSDTRESPVRRHRVYGTSLATKGCIMAKKHARKSASPKTGARKKAAKRELIDTGTDKRFVRRRAKGRFGESDDVGKSLRGDRRTKAKTKAKRGQGDKGDR